MVIIACRQNECSIPLAERLCVRYLKDGFLALYKLSLASPPSNSLLAGSENHGIPRFVFREPTHGVLARLWVDPVQSWALEQQSIDCRLGLRVRKPLVYYATQYLLGCVLQGGHG